MQARSPVALWSALSLPFWTRQTLFYLLLPWVHPTWVHRSCHQPMCWIGVVDVQLDHLMRQVVMLIAQTSLLPADEPLDKALARAWEMTFPGGSRALSSVHVKVVAWTRHIDLQVLVVEEGQLATDLVRHYCHLRKLA